MVHSIILPGVVVDKNHYYTADELEKLKYFVVHYKSIKLQEKVNKAHQKIKNLMSGR